MLCYVLRQNYVITMATFVADKLIRIWFSQILRTSVAHPLSYKYFLFVNTAMEDRLDASFYLATLYITIRMW